MGAEAIQLALDDAGISWKDIQFGFGGSYEKLIDPFHASGPGRKTTADAAGARDQQRVLAHLCAKTSSDAEIAFYNLQMMLPRPGTPIW